ncbi:LPXTG cell wall anchor domain-containing protein [Carnobacterium maltaromaticum]|uniref:LPXTG cell wall anchor domain-containing protein n=1 Tax=Carnobacterium maltaromaticum TaxID=2751 RepID=UPI00295E69A5|nr:LPXTG cell wall anchor domain-containing protein [Carnobacterium maltaromaticum]
MKENKHVLFLLMIILLSLSNSTISIASTTTSYSGIYFTEAESKEPDPVDTSNKKVEVEPVINRDRTGWKLPQTGNQNHENVLILGLIFLFVSMIMGQLSKIIGGKK